MLFGKKLKAAFNVLTKATNDFSNVFLSRSDLRNGMNVNDPYSQSAWVYACVTVIMRKLSSVPYVLVERKADSEGQRKEITEGASYELFRNPNPMMSRSELWEFTAMAKLLTGGCLWVYDVENGKVKNIWPFHQTAVTPLVNKRRLMGWRIHDGEVQFTAPLEATTFHRFLSPKKPILGQAPLEAAETSYRTDLKASQFNESLFDNSGMPSGMMSIPEFVDDVEADRLEKRWKRNHEGFLKAGGTGFIYGGAKYETTSFDMEKMQVSELKKLYREDIFGVFGVPPAEVQVYEYANYANAEAQAKKFWENTLIPSLVSVEEKNDGQYFLRYDPLVTAYFDLTNVEALKEDLKDKIASAKVLHSMGVPYARADGLLQIGVDTTDLPHLHKGWHPFNLVEAGSEGDDEGKALPKTGRIPKEDDPRKLFHNSLLKLEKDREEKKLKSQQSMANVLRNNQKPFVRAWEKKMKSYFSGQRVRVQSNLRDHYEDLSKAITSKDWPDHDDFIKALDDDISQLIFSIDEETGLLIEATSATLEGTINGGAETMAEIIGQDFTILSPTVLEALMDREEIYTLINDLSFEKVSDAISLSIENGETTTEAVERIRTVYSDMTPGRAMNIAQTETANAFNGGSFEFAKQEGIKKHTWMDSGDDRVRDSHQNQGTVKIGKKFPNGFLYPNDFRERCVAVPEID